MSRLRTLTDELSVGPMECMPNKISEAQFFHVAEKEGLAALTLSLNGDPVDPEVVDNFAFEDKARFRPRADQGHAVVPTTLLGRSHRVLAGLGFGRPRWLPTPPPAPARTGVHPTAPPAGGPRRSVHLPVIVDSRGQD